MVPKLQCAAQPSARAWAERRQMASSARTRVRAAAAGPSQAAGGRAGADARPCRGWDLAGTWPPSGTLTVLLLNTRRGVSSRNTRGLFPKTPDEELLCGPESRSSPFG